MEPLNHECLIRTAWQLHKITAYMRKIMNELYFNEFCDLDEEEMREQAINSDQPF